MNNPTQSSKIDRNLSSTGNDNSSNNDIAGNDMVLATRRSTSSVTCSRHMIDPVDKSRDIIRCTSAQPVFVDSGNDVYTHSSRSADTGPPLDTKQIQFYFKNLKEESAKLCESDNEVDTFVAKHKKGPVKTATRTSIFSMSSSLDSSKEERFVSYLEHNPTTGKSVVTVIPKPQQQIQTVVRETGILKDNVVDQFSGGDQVENLKNSGRWHSTTDLAAEISRIFPLGHRLPSPSIRSSDYPNDLKKSLCPSPPERRPRSHSSQRRSSYIGELVWQVDETVFCGGIEAVQNQNLLCRLSIEYIIDLSGQSEYLNITRPRTECPCLCPKRTAHSRMTVSINIRDDSNEHLLKAPSDLKLSDTKMQQSEREEIIRYFETLIDLIRKARIARKKVLIHSVKGRNRAPAFVAAYLMHSNRCSRVQAIAMISNMVSAGLVSRPSLCISDNLQRALMRWQNILGIRSENNCRMDSSSLSKMFTIKRNAWN